MTVRFTNNARSTLQASISPSDTTFMISAEDAGKFPPLGVSEDWFPLTLVDSLGNMEIVHVTARSGAALTVTRAQEATTAKSFASGTPVSLRSTAAMMAEILHLAQGNHLHTISQITGLTDFIADGLAGKLSIAGGSMSGPLFFGSGIGSRLSADGGIVLYKGTADSPRISFSSPSMDWWVFQDTQGAFVVHRNAGAYQAFAVTSFGSLFWANGAASLLANGNLTGSLWLNWGASDAFGAIASRIEARAQSWAQSWADNRISSLQYRKVTESLLVVGAGATVVASPGAVMVGVQVDSGRAIQYIIFKYLQVFDPVRGWVGFGEA